MTVRRTARILRKATAGLDERGDVLIILSPAEEIGGVQIDVESTLKSLFGGQIRTSVLRVVEGYGLKDLKISVCDQGALDYAIRARVQTAVARAVKEGE